MSDESRSKVSGYYARVLGTFWRHPRTSTLTLAARGLWVSMLSWCADQRSDGDVPVHALVMVAAGQATARPMAELEASGLVVKGPTTYTLRDWSQHNITREKHDAYNAKKAAAMAAGRATKRSGSGTVAAHVPDPLPVTAPATERQPLEQEQEQEQTLPSGSVARAPDPPEPVRVREPTLAGVDPVEAALRRGYAKRYEHDARDAWMTHARDNPHIQRAAAWCRTQPRPFEAAERFLDGAFAHEPWRKWRWKWEFLVEDCGLTASRSSIAVGSMGQHTTQDAAIRERVDRIPTMDLTNAEGDAW